MKFSESWLRQYVNPSLSTEELVAQITMAGLEVDGVESASPEITGVVVGEIIAVEQHPDADKLRVCQVSGNGDAQTQVVCGASNARVGIKVPFATVGANLPEGFKIKKAKNHIVNYIDKQRIDLLYTSTSVIISGGLAAKKSGIPSISHVHEIPTSNKLYEIFIGLFVRYFSKTVIVVSNSVAKHWQPYLKRNQLFKVYNGIIFPFTNASFNTKSKTVQNITVTSIARLIPYKGHKYFIEVAKELIKLNDQYQFLIVGDTFSGYESYEEELKILVSENDLHQNIHFLGYRSDVQAILGKTDLFFHPSIAPDPLPTVLFEAIKMKVPLVATKLGGAVEILDNGNCGLLVPHNNEFIAADLINDYYRKIEAEKDDNDHVEYIPVKGITEKATYLFCLQ